MSWIGRILLVANVGGAVATACLVLAVYVAPESASSSVEPGAPGVFRVAVRGSTTFDVLALFAGVLVIADFLWVVYGSRPAGPPAYVVSEGPGGPLRISRDALENALRNAGESLEQVSRVRVTVDASPGMKRIFVRAHFHAPENASVHEASGQLRVVLARSFHELVRLAEGARLEVEIEFLGFAGKPLRRAQPGAEDTPRAEPDEPDEPFTGPRYPIGD